MLSQQTHSSDVGFIITSSRGDTVLRFDQHGRLPWVQWSDTVEISTCLSLVKLESKLSTIDLCEVISIQTVNRR